MADQRWQAYGMAAPGNFRAVLQFPSLYRWCEVSDSELVAVGCDVVYNTTWSWGNIQALMAFVWGLGSG